MRESGKVGFAEWLTEKVKWQVIMLAILLVVTGIVYAYEKRGVK